jgi:hypothetical protein
MSPSKSPGVASIATTFNDNGISSRVGLQDGSSEKAPFSRQVNFDNLSALYYKPAGSCFFSKNFMRQSL